MRQLVARCVLRIPVFLVGGEWILFWLEPFTLHGALVYDSISADQLVTARGYTPAVVIYLHVITPILASTSIHGMAGMQVAP